MNKADKLPLLSRIYILVMNRGSGNGFMAGKMMGSVMEGMIRGASVVGEGLQW